jgi:hypothetical protein
MLDEYRPRIRETQTPFAMARRIGPEQISLGKDGGEQMLGFDTKTFSSFATDGLPSTVTDIVGPEEGVVEVEQHRARKSS